MADRKTYYHSPKETATQDTKFEPRLSLLGKAPKGRVQSGKNFRDYKHKHQHLRDKDRTNKFGMNI
tara:strand:- start:116 stop:313 length:198 start_codon:yes stop_codon:yes gene_type:complete